MEIKCKSVDLLLLTLARFQCNEHSNDLLISHKIGNLPENYRIHKKGPVSWNKSVGKEGLYAGNCLCNITV
jgi:hypothetical protein